MSSEKIRGVLLALDPIRLDTWARPLSCSRCLQDLLQLGAPVELGIVHASEALPDAVYSVRRLDLHPDRPASFVAVPAAVVERNESPAELEAPSAPAPAPAKRERAQRPVETGRGALFTPRPSRPEPPPLTDADAPPSLPLEIGLGSSSNRTKEGGPCALVFAPLSIHAWSTLRSGVAYPSRIEPGTWETRLETWDPLIKFHAYKGGPELLGGWAPLWSGRLPAPGIRAVIRSWVIDGIQP